MVQTTIKIKRGGCGVNYTDGNGVTRYALKTPKDGEFLCEIEQAKRLVALGVAEYAGDDKEAKEGVGVSETGRLDAAQLESMDFNELKKLAKDMGVTPAGKKKTDYIEALVAVEVDLGPTPEETDGDEPPALGVVDPE